MVNEETAAMPPTNHLSRTTAMYRRLFRLSLLLLALSFIAVCIVLFSLRGILGNVDPETIDRQTLVRVIQIRDFRQFSPDLIERITDRAEKEFGRHSPNKPIIELHPLEKRIHLYFQENRSNRQSHFESNLTLMARIRFFQWMREYQSATLAQRAMLMSDVVEDMRYWQEFYFEYLRFLGQPEPTLMELHEDFQRMIEAFKVDASPEEVEQIDSFAQTMSRALFAAEVQQNIMDLIPQLRWR